MPLDSTSAQYPRLRWPVLKPVSQDPDSKFVRVNRNTCVVGDRSPVHLPLRSPMVSRTHALIIVDEDDVYIRDLASSNRIYLNGAPVRESSLRPADLLQIGPYRFRCYSGFSKDASLRERQEDGRNVSLVFAGSARSRRIDSRTFLIGRRAECDLPLTSPAVSQVHAVIFRRGESHYVRDLNSRCGTHVNGRKVREAELKDGDELRIATAMFTYRIEEAQIPQPTIVADSNDSGSWLPAELCSLSSGSMSVSKSIGTETVQNTGAEPLETVPAPLNLEAPEATPEELGLIEEPDFAPTLHVEILTDPGLATASELFSTEISLSSARIFRAAGAIPRRNGSRGH
ncbi:MAG TPA: FHA domain-containing protein [Tepidisphaeraceae bacterium]|nr:FHA domain-containing protein [Tepidisphaeraceae bacterium]